MSYIKNNFLLTTETAEKLYFSYAKDMPIFDYHCHLPENVYSAGSFGRGSLGVEENS